MGSDSVLAIVWFALLLENHVAACPVLQMLSEWTITVAAPQRLVCFNAIRQVIAAVNEEIKLQLASLFLRMLPSNSKHTLKNIFSTEESLQCFFF